MFPSYETIKWFYENNCYSNEEIEEFVSLGCLTKEQYEMITGEDFPNHDIVEWK